MKRHKLRQGQIEHRKLQTEFRSQALMKLLSDGVNLPLDELKKETYELAQRLAVKAQKEESLRLRQPSRRWYGKKHDETIALMCSVLEEELGELYGSS